MHDVLLNQSGYLTGATTAFRGKYPPGDADANDFTTPSGFDGTDFTWFGERRFGNQVKLWDASILEFAAWWRVAGGFSTGRPGPGFVIGASVS
jgi:hypothetical protein